MVRLDMLDKNWTFLFCGQILDKCLKMDWELQLDKCWTKIGLGQNLDKVWTSNLVTWPHYEIDKTWTKYGHFLSKVCPILKSLDKEISLGQFLDKWQKFWTGYWQFLDKLSKISIILTNIGHWQNLDKGWTNVGQNLDICPKFVKILSNHTFYRSTL